MTTTPQRVLVIEDEAAMALMLKHALEEAAFSVTIAEEGLEGLKKLQEDSFDLVLLDINLPRLSGFGLLDRARAEGIKTPIIVITARDATTDRVHGLDSGADDYLLKPFRVQELLARVRAQLRRSAESTTVFHCGNVSIDTQKRAATCLGKTIPLSPTEYLVLQMLMKNVGEPVSKTSLLKHVWKEPGYRDPNIVEVYIRILRDKLENARATVNVQTIRGQGYMLTADA
jgi:DNA-binding response OmpR family regulator